MDTDPLWVKQYEWIEYREPGEPDMSHVAEAIWGQGLGVWIDRYSEYVRVKEAAIGEVWDAESVIRSISWAQGYEIRDRFGRYALDLLEKRVKQDSAILLDPEKVANAREFCRPFEDLHRKLKARPPTPEQLALEEQELREDIEAERLA